MEKIEQGIKKLYENGINYQNINKEINKYNEGEIIKNYEDFFSLIEYRKSVSIITGSNGIGKTYLLKQIEEKFNNSKRKVLLIELKKYNSLNDLENDISDECEVLIFDGLDEINSNIIGEVIRYIFSIKNKNIILSSRKDFLQKSNMANDLYNVYEIMPIEEYKINEILESKGIDILKKKDIINLLKIPRFLLYILENIEPVKLMKEINRYNILNLIIDNHFDTLNDRATTKIEKNIHKKVLQSMALVMMMSGKTNLTFEEFTTFLCKINYLDIKAYILNKEIIESFLNNQLILNDGKSIQFENKEFLEFFAAKEIIENNFSNGDLYNVVINENSEIDAFWFNTISYLVCKSKIYKKLILDYIYNNIENEDNLINLLLNIDFQIEDKEYILKISQKAIFQYTKLYQYLGFNDNNITDMLFINYKEVLTNLVNILINIDFKKVIDEFYIIYINNILSIVNDILDKYSYSLDNLEALKNFLIINERIIVNDERFNVRYFTIYFKLIEYPQIDKLLSVNTSNNRLLSLALYECKSLDKLKNLDILVNNYIKNYNKRFDNEMRFVINENLIREFILKNYTFNRSRKMISQIKSDSDITSFLRFVNNNIEILNKFKSKTLAKTLNKKIVKSFLSSDTINSKEFRDEIMFERSQGKCFAKIIEICVKQELIKVEDLLSIDLSNYIAYYVCELVVKSMLSNNIKIENIYSHISKKELIFYVWRDNMSDDEKDIYTSNIKEMFPKLYRQYLVSISKRSNKKFIDVENKMQKINNSTNIFYIIDRTYDIVQDDERFALINSDGIMKNIYNQIIIKVNKYVINLDVSKLVINCKSDKTYSISYDFEFYSKAIWILEKSGKDINEYNDKNIILLNDNEIKLQYSEKNYNTLIKYLNAEKSEGYIHFYLHQIIENLKIKHSKELCALIFQWLDKYTFEEYQMNQLLSVICENIDTIDETSIKKIQKIRNYKSCQDVLIMLNIESEISNRIEYIKENLVFQGDTMSIEKDGNFEYSSGYYTSPLSNIDIKYINYIVDITEFAFKKYNEGEYFSFTKYILDMVTKFIKSHIDELQVNSLIKRIIELEKKNKDRYLYNICKSIYNIKETNIQLVGVAVSKLNSIIQSDAKKIYSYDELLNIVKEILEKNIFDDIKRMNFFEIFRDNEGKIKRLKEQVFQFLIGYELDRILTIKGINTKIVYESTGFDKKRNDIQLISEGFIQNIVIETKLTENRDISNEDNIKNYINTTLKKYKSEFNSPKILFVLINQTNNYNTCNKKIDQINNNSNDFVLPVLINLKDIFPK